MNPIEDYFTKTNMQRYAAIRSDGELFKFCIEKDISFVREHNEGCLKFIGEMDFIYNLTQSVTIKSRYYGTPGENRVVAEMVDLYGKDYGPVSFK